jgi:exodeoxyribonuclease-3
VSGLSTPNGEAPGTDKYAFERGWGLRIDHILLAPALASKCSECSIDIEPRKRERPSDHSPVIAQSN